MSSTLRIAFLAVILAGTIAAPAQAGWKVDRAQAIAEHVWDYDYGCAGGVVVRWADPALAFGAEVTAAQLARGREVLAWTDPTAAETTRCIVNFNGPLAKRWGTDWTELCSTMIHEYGHLAGYTHPVGVREPDGTIDHTHSPSRRSIMSPDYKPDRRCRKRGRPYLDRYELR